MRFLIYATVVAIGLSGCNSFNTYDQTARHQGQQEKSQKKKKEDKGLLSFLFGSDDSSDSQPSDQQTTTSVAVRDENGKLLCPIEKFTNVGNMPALPTDQLRQLGPNDKDAIIRLLTNHIDELRQHGRKVQDQQNAEHRRYINDCRRWLLQHQQ